MLYFSNYTKEQKNSCGVYKILNNKTGNFYIGSSVNMRKRKSQHSLELRKNQHANTFLQNAWNKYGEDNFTFEILWYCSRDEQIDAEQKFMDLLKPKYNLLKKAFVRSEEVQKLVNRKLRKRYYIINAEGIQMCTDNLKGFCEDHKLDRAAFAHLMVDSNKSGRDYYKGWYITDDPNELKEENRYTKEQWYQDNVDRYRLAREEYITYMWDTKTDKAYVIGDVESKTHLTMHDFCEEFELTKESLRGHFNKGRKNYKQWVIYREYKYKDQPTQDFLTKYYEENKGFKVRKKRKSIYTYIATSPTGAEYIIDRDVKGFCEEYGLDTSSFLKVARGKLKTVKKWKVKRI